jgi:hypothetical protein
MRLFRNAKSAPISRSLTRSGPRLLLPRTALAKSPPNPPTLGTTTAPGLKSAMVFVPPRNTDWSW